MPPRIRVASSRVAGRRTRVRGTAVAVFKATTPYSSTRDCRCRSNRLPSSASLAVGDRATDDDLVASRLVAAEHDALVALDRHAHLALARANAAFREHPLGVARL